MHPTSRLLALSGNRVFVVGSKKIKDKIFLYNWIKLKVCRDILKMAIYLRINLTVL